MPTLANLYDADLRRTDPTVGQLAAGQLIPHPLRNVEYADGVFMRCTHAKKHARFERCPPSPKSCRCGGPWAWVRVEGCKETMIGCVCHHAPANDRVVERLRVHSHDLGHIREDFVAGMVAAYETTQQGGATAADREKIHDFVGQHLKALRDRQYTLREARRTFGSELHGIALLFHLEARTSLSGDSEALARLVPLRDLGWPTDVLMDEYRDEGVVWEPWQRGRFDTLVESWKLAHPQNGVE